jgi:hypothetical protein
MNSRLILRAASFIALLGIVALLLRPIHAEGPPAPTEPKTSATVTAPPVDPKPLTETTKGGLRYLISQQQANGGWGQGGGWRQNSQNGGRVEGPEVSDPVDLGNTCIATLALVRAGNTPVGGPYAANVAKAVALVCESIEAADSDSLYVTQVRDTQIQSKIGQYVDTFLAGLLLSELKGKLGDEGAEKRLAAALDKTVRKIEKNQDAQGNFAGNTGWASVLSQAVCSKFINRAAQAQVAVSDEVLNRDFAGSVASLDLKTGEFAAAAPAPLAASGRIAARASAGGVAGGVEPSARTSAAASTSGPSDAGVKLYLGASNASRINDLGNTSVLLEKRAKVILADKYATPAAKEKAETDLKRVDEIRAAQVAAVDGIASKLDDKDFIAGFGNNGGEEFLSYMNIGEMLVVKRGDEWNQWEQGMSANLDRVQNEDGSWSGQHCITGRTFCTAAALLTLLADRAPVPVADAAAAPQK